MINLSTTDVDFKNLLEAKRRELADAELKITVLVRMVTERDAEIASLQKTEEETAESSKE